MFCHVSIIASECSIIVPSFLAHVSIMCPSCSHWFPIFRIFSTMRPSMFNHDPSLSIMFYIIFHHVNVLSTMSHQFESKFHHISIIVPSVFIHVPSISHVGTCSLARISKGKAKSMKDETWVRASLVLSGEWGNQWIALREHLLRKAPDFTRKYREIVSGFWKPSRDFSNQSIEGMTQAMIVPLPPFP